MPAVRRQAWARELFEAREVFDGNRSGLLGERNYSEQHTAESP
jgi:hypothetical protein